MSFLELQLHLVEITISTIRTAVIIAVVVALFKLFKRKNGDDDDGDNRGSRFRDMTKSRYRLYEREDE